MKMFGEIHRIIIVGGEPFYYRGLGDIIRAPRKVHGEIEIFTNGLPLISNKEGTRKFIEKYLPENDRLVVTISIDDFHRRQMGEYDFKKIIDAAMEILNSGIADVKFNITDPEFYSHSYLNYKVVKDLLDTYDSSLKELFENCFRSRRVDEIFYFNPVIRHGTGKGGEAIRAIDLLRYPEIVVGRRRGDGRISIMKHLSALWMDPAPESLVAGYPLDEDIEMILIKNVITPLIGSSENTEVKDILQWVADEAGVDENNLIQSIANCWNNAFSKRIIKRIKEKDREKVADLLAVAKKWTLFVSNEKTVMENEEKEVSRIFDIVDSGQQFSMLLSTRPDAPGLGRAALGSFVEEYKRIYPSKYESAIKILLEEIVGKYKEGMAPYQDGTMLYMGRIVDDEGELIPLERARFINDSSEIDESVQIFPICFNIQVSESDGIAFKFDFVDYKKTSGEKLRRSVAMAIGSFLRFMGEDASICNSLFDKHDCAELRDSILETQKSSSVSGRRNYDAVKRFNSIFYDHRTGMTNWENMELLELIISSEISDYSDESIVRLRKEAADRRERLL